jgi:hypothetical protein
MTSPPKRLSFPASTLDRVIACPGSVALEQTVPRKETFSTDEGHAAHQLAQWALTDGAFDARAYMGRKIVLHSNKGTPQETKFEFTVDAEMCKHAQAYVDHVKARLDAYKADKNVKDVTLHVEKRIDTSTVTGQPGQSGIADTLIVVAFKDGTGLISVEDFKYGQSSKIYAKNNTQLMTYAAGALETYGKALDITAVNMVIHMPRMRHVSEASVTAQELRVFAAKAKTGVTQAVKEQKLFVISNDKADLTLNAEPAKQCRFCRAKDICPAFNAASKKPAPPKPGTPEPPKPPAKPRPDYPF